MNNEQYMQQALELAAKGAGWASPNPMVGAVVVKEGRVVGRGYHEKCGGPHAEVNALADAGEAARGADIYVTLEPCNHTGKTPPCTRAVLTAGVKRVFAAMADPNPHVAGQGMAFLASKGIQTHLGILEEQAKKLNEAFIKHITTGLPFVIAKAAATLDGKTGSHTGDSKWITNDQSRAYVHQMRHAYDAIAVGAGTVQADDPSLTARIEGKKTKDPLRVILDTWLSTPTDARVLRQDSDSGTWVFCGPDASRQKREGLEQAGAKVLQVGADSSGRLDLAAVLKELGREKVMSLFVEGGAHIHGSMFRAGVVDKVNFFFAPKILGGDGLPMTAGEGPDNMIDALELSDVEVRRFGNDVMIQGYVKKEPEK